MFKNILQKPESYRRRFAALSALALTLVVFSSWVLSNGFIGGATIAKTESAKQVASVVGSAPSPLQTSKGAIDGAWGEIVAQYDALKQSLSNVFVPFVTGIEVYNSNR